MMHLQKKNRQKTHSVFIMCAEDLPDRIGDYENGRLYC